MTGTLITLGRAAAAVAAAGVGVFVTGLATTLAEASPKIKAALLWSPPVGPLSGKTGVGVIAWLLAWGILYLAWRDREVDFDRVYRVTLALIAGGLILTFPLVFEAFTAH